MAAPDGKISPDGGSVSVIGDVQGAFFATDAIPTEGSHRREGHGKASPITDLLMVLAVHFSSIVHLNGQLDSPLKPETASAGRVAAYASNGSRMA